jgi:transcriptional regulator with XRE-family HTH domain
MTSPTPDVSSVASVPGRGEGYGSVVLRMVLGAQLRRLRAAAGVTGEDAAYRIRASAAKISRMELGRVRFKERDLVDLLVLYGVRDEAERAEFVALARRANADGWWQRDRDLLPAWFEPYLGMEQAATLIRVFETRFVPGLMQTQDYARAVVRLGHASDDEVERRVQLRLRRQQVLGGSMPPRVWAVLDEAVLRRRVAAASVMRHQLDHLLELGERPEMTLQVATLDGTPHHGAGGSFTILRFGATDLPDVVYMEHLNGALYLDKPADVEDYVEVWNRLCVAAESPARSAALIRGIRESCG